MTTQQEKGLAFALGRSDGRGLVTRDEALGNARSVVAATDLPVSADLENGFGHEALRELGVRRVSLGSSLNRTALGAFMEGAREVMEKDTFTYAQHAASMAELDSIFESDDD